MTPPPRVPDAELLQRFARHRDEAAFELLVWRYQRLVAGVCRRTAGDHHAAEDAAQATFLLLARRADRVRRAEALPGWLARVAYRCAVRARASGGRQPPVAPWENGQSFRAGGNRGLTPPARPDDADLELYAALDAELDRLPDRLRLPVVLVHLDGRTYADAAQALNIPVGTLSGRLRKARDLLKHRLTRRGLAPLAAVVALDPGRVATAALAFAAGHPVPNPSAVLALGVLRAMTLPKLVGGAIAGLVLVAAVGFAVPRPRPPAVPDRDRLQGEWLFESATAEADYDALRQYSTARIVFRGDRVTVSGHPYGREPAAADFALDPAAAPKRIDWGRAAGIYQLDADDRLTVCLNLKPGSPKAPRSDRPTEFRSDGRLGHFTFALRRWRSKPGEPLGHGVTVTVLDPDGKPAAGATITTGVEPWHAELGLPPTPPVTDAAGVVRITTPVVVLTARLPERKLVGLATVSPASQHYGTTVRLEPAVTVTGTLATDRPSAAGIGATGVYLKRPGRQGVELADVHRRDGRFEFVVPAGVYELVARGEHLRETRTRLVVPAGVATVDAGTLTGRLSWWGAAVGRPAPELPAIAGWVGPPTTLAAHKGKVVLLWFTDVGHPHAHPPRWDDVRKYADKGLAVIGVNLDGGPAAVRTPAELVARAKATPPFPVALSVGESAVREYWQNGAVRTPGVGRIRGGTLAKRGADRPPRGGATSVGAGFDRRRAAGRTARRAGPVAWRPAVG